MPLNSAPNTSASKGLFQGCQSKCTAGRMETDRIAVRERQSSIQRPVVRRSTEMVLFQRSFAIAIPLEVIVQKVQRAGPIEPAIATVPRSAHPVNPSRRQPETPRVREDFDAPMTRHPVS